MAVKIVDTAGTNELKVDPTSNAARTTLYNTSGTEVGTVANPLTVTASAATGATGSAVPASAQYQGLSDGTNLRGALSASAANLTAATHNAVPLVVPFASWSVTHLPSTATKATISKASGGGSVRHVCTGFIAALATGSTVQTPITCSIRDGATGAGTVLWSAAFSAPANSCFNITQSGLCLIGTAATAMTIEFSAAGVTSSQETVSMQGFSVP